MKIHYTHKDLHSIYEYLVKEVRRNIENERYEKALSHIYTAANFQYWYNEIYIDNRLENGLKHISEKLLNKNEEATKEDVILFYDFLSRDNIGLTQQYVSSLIKDNKNKIIYVTERKLDTPERSDILSMLKNNDITFYELPNGDYTKRIKDLYLILLQNRPKRVFLHIAPWSIIPIVALWAFPNIHKILINLTDHAFELGFGLIDLSLEYRRYGLLLSKHLRCVPENKLCYLPFYPWINELSSFEGFPDETRGKIILFSGGSIYKITDKTNTFFHLIRKILENNPNTVFLYAGSGNSSVLEKLIKRHNLENRFFLLGQRHDIAQVFQHCDIYIGTYPSSGGLMSQYAAYYKKPIIAYATKKSDDIIIGKDEIVYSYDNIEELNKEATKLVTDRQYRENRGERFKSCLIKTEEFTKLVIGISEGEFVGVPYKAPRNGEFDFDVKDKYLELINLNASKGLIERLIVNDLGLCSLPVLPKVYINRLLYILTGKSRLYEKIMGVLNLK